MCKKGRPAPRLCGVSEEGVARAFYKVEGASVTRQS